MSQKKTFLSQKMFTYGTGFCLTIIAFIYYYITGYPYVVTATEVLKSHAPPLYMLSIFPCCGILIGENLFDWIHSKQKRTTLLYSIEYFILSIILLLRIFYQIPISGHTLILGFYTLHELVTNKKQYKLRLILGFLVFGIVIYYKLLIWNDPITFVLGLMLGLIIWIPNIKYHHQKELRRY